ncbi:MAG: hypothetical protein RIK87_05325 [Fuerstiella sp.]
MTRSNIDNPDRPSRQYRYISAALAFVTWGGWAYFINVRSATIDDAPPIVSALMHGTASCIVTLLMLRSVTFLYHRLAGHPLRLVLPAIITTTVTGSCFLTAHWWIGTADLLATIAPGLIVALGFNTLTACKLRAQRQAHSV